MNSKDSQETQKQLVETWMTVSGPPQPPTPPPTHIQINILNLMWIVTAQYKATSPDLETVLEIK